MNHELHASEHILYKILTKKDWDASTKLGFLILQPQDKEFIHLAEKHQIDRIVSKYYTNKKDILIAKIDPSKTIGKLIHEVNPGGLNKYYHLYDGKIPLRAVIDVQPIV